MNATKTSCNKLLVPIAVIRKSYRSKSSAQYCLDTVKQYDYENYAASLLLKDVPRTVAFAVRGFNVEVARVNEQVSQTQIGFMRMKFWEDLVEKCYTKDPSKVPQHPIGIELFKALTKVKLTKRYFMSLVSSRRDSLSSNAFYTLEDMERYADQSVSSVLFLILEGSDVRNVHADHAASHIGKAQGIINQLRSIPYARQLKAVGLPKEICAKHKVSDEEVYRAQPSERLSECVFEVASRAHQHLVKARSFIDKVPAEGRSALLPAVSVDMYLHRLQQVHHDPLHPALKRRHWKLLPSLWFTNVKNKY